MPDPHTTQLPSDDHCHMQCQVCSMYEEGNTDQAARIEAIRHRRLLLAKLHDSADAVAEAGAEIGPCVHCLVRLADSLLAINAHLFVQSFGGDRERAAAEVQRVLLEYIDEHPNTNP